MAPFVSKQLIQHLVTSNPSPAYVSAWRQVFSSNTAREWRHEVGDHGDSHR
jgi:uncharacterized protein (DUF1800 family)